MAGERLAAWQVPPVKCSRRIASRVLSAMEDQKTERKGWLHGQAAQSTSGQRPHGAASANGTLYLSRSASTSRDPCARDPLPSLRPSHTLTHSNHSMSASHVRQPTSGGMSPTGSTALIHPSLFMLADTLKPP